DDVDRAAFERQRAPDGRRVASEFALPIGMREDHARVAAASVIVGVAEKATQRGFDAEHTEVISAHQEGARPARFAGRRRVVTAFAPRENAREYLLLIANALPHRIAETRVRTLVAHRRSAP